MIQFGRQRITRDWWEQERHLHELYISQIVLNEIGTGDPEQAKRRLDLVESIPVLSAREEADALAEGMLSSALLPPNAAHDAAHIALASVHRMDILLTWNCRHIANMSNFPALRRIAENSGFKLPDIGTPEEMLGATYEY